MKTGKSIAELFALVRRRLFGILPVGFRQTPLKGEYTKKVLRFLCAYRDSEFKALAEKPENPARE